MGKRRRQRRPAGGGNGYPRGGGGGGGGQGYGGQGYGGQNQGGQGGRRRRRGGGDYRRTATMEQEGYDNGDSAVEAGFGLLEMHPNGYGFLRSPKNYYARERTDPFVPGTMIEKYRLREGVILRGFIQQARRQQGPRLKELVDVDGLTPEAYAETKSFDELTPINPEQWLRLETGPTPLTTRVMDLLTPLGRGQRALIVAPPRSGKTVMLQHISNGISTNYPNIRLMMLLVDERPEEVTDMRRSVKGEVIASSLDMDIESHVRLSQLVIERCKRLAEMGEDVFLLVDSITRMARAFNKWVGKTGGGRMGIATGGLDVRALDIPKKLFATARCFEEGGSLTIVATALIDTNSKMDEAIFQEFKGTGNMELVLDRRLADRRVWPSIDVTQSGTRREELLHDPETLHAVTMMRRTLSTMNPIDAMEQLTKQLAKYDRNDKFIKLISGAPQQM